MPTPAIKETIREVVREELVDLKQVVNETRDHVSVTNGRVSKLELWKARMEGTRAAYTWFLPVVASAIGGAVGSAVLLLLIHGGK